MKDYLRILIYKAIDTILFQAYKQMIYKIEIQWLLCWMSKTQIQIKRIGDFKTEIEIEEVDLQAKKMMGKIEKYNKNFKLEKIF